MSFPANGADDSAVPVERAASPQLRRVIGVSGLGLSAVNCIVGSGIFGLPALAAAALGPAAVIAYLVCAVLIALVGLCLAEVGSRVSHAGGLYAYATEAFGPVVGGIAGTLLWVANSVVAGAAVSNLLVDTLAMSLPPLGVGLLRTAFLCTVYGVLAAVNVFGARAGAALSTVTALVKVAPLVLLVVVGAFSVHAANLRWPGVPAVSNIGQTSVLLFFAFMGVEGGLNASGEVVDPARTVPRAVFLALAMVATLYIGLQLVAQGVLGAGLPHAAAPLVETATAVFGPWGERFLLAATVLSVAGYLCADMLCSPRNMYAMAERRQLPRILATVDPRLGSPAVAIVTYALLCAVVACSGSFRQLVIAATSGTLVLYLICCLSVFPLRARNVAMQGPPFVVRGGRTVPLAAAAIILWMLSTLTWRELAAAGALVVASGLFYGLHGRRRPARGDAGTEVAPGAAQ